MSDRPAPPRGVRILDLSNFLAGPMVSMFLGDYEPGYHAALGYAPCLIPEEAVKKTGASTRTRWRRRSGR